MFSYRREWLPAARPCRQQLRFCTEALAPLPEAALALDALARFYRNPCRAFFNERCGVRFAEPGEVGQDCEPFALDALQAHAIKGELVQAALRATDSSAAEHSLLARGELPLLDAGRAGREDPAGLHRARAGLGGVGAERKDREQCQGASRGELQENSRP